MIEHARSCFFLWLYITNEKAYIANICTYLFTKPHAKRMWEEKQEDITNVKVYFKYILMGRNMEDDCKNNLTTTLDRLIAIKCESRQVSIF